METQAIQQVVTFDATPEEVYELLMDERKHQAFTEAGATMSREVNGEFEVFDGYCRGYNIELEEGRKIVQAWYFQEEGWPIDHYSLCTFILEQKGPITELSFVQTGVPVHLLRALSEGWRTYYWQPMQSYLAQRSSAV